MKKTSEFKLATIGERTDVEIFTGDYLDILTAEIQAEVDAHKPDMSTEATRKKTIAFAANISKAKVRADGAGKNLNEERTVLSEKVNKRRRQLRDDFDRMRDQARKPVTEWEAAEEAKEEVERQNVIDELDRIERERVADIERREKELLEKEFALAETERLRIAAAVAADLEKERIEREAEIKRQAEEQAKIDAQEAIDKAKREKQQAIDAAETAAKQAEIDKAVAERVAIEKAERDRIAAEEDKERAIVAERNRIAAEKLAEEKAEALREADKKHKAKINNEAAASIVKVLSEAHTGSACESKNLAKDIVAAIAKGQIPHVKISY